MRKFERVFVTVVITGIVLGGLIWNSERNIHANSNSSDSGAVGIVEEIPRVDHKTYFEALPELVRKYPIPRQFQTEDDEYFLVWPDGTVEIATYNGAIFDPEIREWRERVKPD